MVLSLGEFNQELCNEKHKTATENANKQERRLNEHSRRMDIMEEAIIKLTNMCDQISKKDIFDKILIVTLAGMILIILIVIVGMANALKILETIRQVV